ncbi:MAG TPA: c-type cytochrome [bacterium]
MSLITKHAGIVVAAAAAIVMLAFAQPASAQQGKTLFNQKGCPSCHGADANTPLAPNYPKLKGQNADYVVAQIKAFKSGERKGGMSAVMAPMAATVSDAEAVEIAKWISSLK